MAAFAADIEWYYLNADAEQLGPFTLGELGDFYTSEAITDTTFVWHEDIKDEAWASVADVEGLTAAFAGPAEEAAPAAPAAPVEAEAEAKEEAAPSRISRRTSTADGALKSAMQADAKAQTTKRRASVAGKKAPPAAGTDNDTLLKLLSQKKYVDQAQWFLNAYWEGAQNEKGNLCFAENPEERERVWEYFQSCHKYDKKLAEDGNELDEYEAHMFLEKNMGALTVKKLREVLAEMDVDFNQKVSLTEFLIYHYKIDYNYLVTAVVNDEESERMINEAKALVEAGVLGYRPLEGSPLANWTSKL